jgi:hypothetical protein
MARTRAMSAIVLAAVTSVTLILIAAVASASRPAVPVLGNAHAFPAGKGFGTVKPKTVYFGGDPTGKFTNLTWTGWGSARSKGKGKGYYPPPGKPVADAVRVPVDPCCLVTRLLQRASRLPAAGRDVRLQPPQREGRHPEHLLLARIRFEPAGAGPP